MNHINNEMATSPNLSYTSRDYNSIYNELLNSIPLLTKEWDANDENDPGVVLIKLMSMLGDMLSFMQDKNALEVYPRTVLQRANAQQIFRLVGYKMRWYRSAKVKIQITNNNSFPVYIGRFATFYTRESDIYYTNLNPIEINTGEGDFSFSTELIQGVPVTPKMISSVAPDNLNANWHDSYDYNCQANLIKNNRLYLKYNKIDETSIMIIDNDETPFAINEWKLVDNININNSMDKVFEFDVDENGDAFIEFPSYWNTKYVITKFKIFFVLSDGKNGEIEENTISGVNTNKCYTNQENINISSVLSLINIFNESSTYGYSPETCVEARKNAENYINTLDTLITLTDFENAVKRIESVANCIATDLQIDPDSESMNNNQINLWVVRKNNYNNLGSNYIYNNFSDTTISDTLFKETIISELSSHKLMPYNINVNLEDRIDWISWTVKGQLCLREPISSIENKDLMVTINNNLSYQFNTETLDFNESINYMDVIECVLKSNKNIWHVDLTSSNIEYKRIKRSKKGSPTGNIIKTKYKLYNIDRENSTSYTGYYVTSFGYTTIELEKLKEYDIYNDIINNEDPNYLPGSTLNGLNYNYSKFNDDVITPGGNGSNKNMGNVIRGEDDKIVSLLGFSNETGAREYEIYNGHIIDWTGFEPIETNYKVVLELTGINANKFVIKNKNNGEIKYIFEEEHDWYLPDGTKTNKYLNKSYHQISQLCNNLTSEDILTELEIVNKTKEEKDELVLNNKLRLCYDIIDDEDNIHSTIDQISGEIFIKRGKYWYSTFKTYDSATGEILNDKGDVIVGPNVTFEYEDCSKEDLTGEYIQNIDPTLNVDENGNYKDDYSFYLGQDENGNQIVDSIGNIINAYPIKPYNLFIYINGDEYIINDNGSGKLNGTNNILNGYGNIDYSTGKINFKLNIIPSSIRILYRINKLTYAVYETFDTNEFFVKPEYLRYTNRL